MTLEEAAEVILGGRAWVDCDPCRGKGWERKPKIEVGDRARINASGTLEVVLSCTHCKGSGGSVVREYAEACAILGRDLPSHVTERLNAYFVQIKKMQATAMAVVEEATEKFIGAPSAPAGIVTAVNGDGTANIRRHTEYGQNIEYVYQLRADDLSLPVTQKTVIEGTLDYSSKEDP